MGNDTGKGDGALGSFLRRRREEIGLTAKEVEKRSQHFPRAFRLSQSYLSEIENRGKMPSPLRLLTLARLYGITIAEIYQVLGADDTEIGVDMQTGLAQRLLYSDPDQRNLHNEIQELLEIGLDAPIRNLTSEFQLLLDEQRSAMLQVIRDSQAKAACVVASEGRILLDFGLTDMEKEALRRGQLPQGPEWRQFEEGDPNEFHLCLLLKEPQLKEPIEATIIVPLVRWWAGLKSLIRRFERQP